LELIWTERASRDLVRLHDFLEPLDPEAAAKIIVRLMSAPEKLLAHPRMGQRLEDGEREIRRLVVAPCEIQYEINGPCIFVLTVWHGREQR